MRDMTRGANRASRTNEVKGRPGRLSQEDYAERGCRVLRRMPIELEECTVLAQLPGVQRLAKQQASEMSPVGTAIRALLDRAIGDVERLARAGADRAESAQGRVPRRRRPRKANTADDSAGLLPTAGPSHRRLAATRGGRRGPRDAALIQTALAYSKASAWRLTRLAGDLMDDARIRGGCLTVRLAPCDLGAIVRAAVEEQRALEVDRAIHLHAPVGVPIPIEADAERIGQVVTNYLTNALKYSEAGRPVAVRLEVLEPGGDLSQ